MGKWSNWGKSNDDKSNESGKSGGDKGGGKGKGDDGVVGGHDSNKRPSNLAKHERGDARRGRDQGGEKGDTRRPFRKSGGGRTGGRGR
jgi:hypothetical protein